MGADRAEKFFHSAKWHEDVAYTDIIGYLQGLEAQQIDIVKFGNDLFDAYHQILPKFNSFHLQSPTTTRKLYILKSMPAGLMSYGILRTST